MRPDQSANRWLEGVVGRAVQASVAGIVTKHFRGSRKAARSLILKSAPALVWYRDQGRHARFRIG